MTYDKWPPDNIEATFLESQGWSLYTVLTVQAALVIRGLFICEFAYSHYKNGLKWHFSSQKWTFYLQVQDSRSKVTERIYRE